MKILLIHYRYFINSGAERYLFNVSELLSSKGHEVIPFSVNYPNSEKTQYNKYFVNPVISEFHVSQQNLSVITKLRIALSFVYNLQAKKKIKKLIKDTQPDIAYVLLYHGKLTYSVLEACKEMKVPIVHRISDFYHYCVCSSFYKKGKICTECLKNKTACIRNRCVHGSLLQTVLNYFAEEKESKSGIRNYISSIICPSSFTKKIYEENCIYPNAVFTHIPTFFNFDTFPEVSKSQIIRRKKNGIISFVGRISPEKGIDSVIEAWKIIEKNKIPCKLVLTGFSDDSYGNKIKELIRVSGLKNIACFDFLSKKDIFEIINRSFATLIPSVWFDNMPNSFIESQAFSVPVIANDIGSLTELVNSGENGLLAEVNNSDSLYQQIVNLYTLSDEEYILMSEKSRAFVMDYCSKTKHYDRLIQVFNSVIEKKQ